jgi:protein phosphatase 1 regulatory subunit 16A
MLPSIQYLIFVFVEVINFLFWCTSCHSLVVGLPTSYVTGGNGNINIHVSVTINAGTLADLKKQRSQIRNNSPDGMTTSLSPISSVTSSPMPSVQRFTGDTDDVVGDPKPKRCCVIS